MWQASSNQLAAYKQKLNFPKTILPQDSNSEALSVYSLLSYPKNFRLASSHNHMSYFLKKIDVVV